MKKNEVRNICITMLGTIIGIKIYELVLLISNGNFSENYFFNQLPQTLFYVGVLGGICEIIYKINIGFHIYNK